MKIALMFPATPFNVNVLPHISYISGLYGRMVSQLAKEKIDKLGLKLKASPADGYRVILGLLTAASMLKDDGHTVKYYQEDYMINAGSYEKQLKEISESDCVFIAFSTPQYLRVKEITEKLKSYNPNILIAVMGREPTSLDEKVLNDFSCDICIRGDGENTIHEITLIFDKSKSIERMELCKGITFKHKNKIIRTSDAPPVDLNTMPSPDFSILPKDFVDKANVSLTTSRGCGFKCAYCYETSFWGNVRYRPIEKVVEDLNEYFKYFPFNHVFFHDSTFTMNKKRTIELTNSLKKEFGNEFSYSCNARGETLNRDILNNLKKTGCLELFMGIDNASDAILKKMNRKGDISNNIRMIEKANKEIPLIVCSTIMGLPGETYETATNTIKLSQKLIRKGIFQVTTRLFVPYPGTPVFHNPQEYGVKILSSDFSRYDRYSYPPVIRLSNLNEFELYGLFEAFFGMATAEAGKKIEHDIYEDMIKNIKNVKSQNPYKTVYYSG